MTTTTTAQALTTKQPGDIVSDMIGSVSFTYIQIDPHFKPVQWSTRFFFVRSFTDSQQTIFQKKKWHFNYWKFCLNLQESNFFLRIEKIVYF